MENIINEIKASYEMLVKSRDEFFTHLQNIHALIENLQCEATQLTKEHNTQLLDMYNALGMMIQKDRGGINKNAYAIRVQDLEMSGRLRHVLNGAWIETLGDLCSFPETDFCRVRNCGIKTFYEARHLLEKFNLKFGDDTWTQLQGYEFRLNLMGEYNRKMLTETNDEV